MLVVLNPTIQCVCLKYSTGFIVALDVNEMFLDGAITFAYASYLAKTCFTQ